MEMHQLLTLGGLALVDSTSFGTLAVPVLLLLARRPQIKVLLTYLGAIAVFYWALGLLLVLGGSSVSGWLESLGDSMPEGGRTLLWGQAIVGAVLLVGSFWIDGPAAQRRRERRAARGEASRRDRWTARLTSGQLGTGAVVTIAVLAGLIEAASMLPYLGAVAIITTSGLDLVGVLLVLAAYVLVMVTPALALTGVRLGLGRRAEPALSRVHSWVERSADGIMGWVVGILGFLVLRDALARLFGWMTLS